MLRMKTTSELAPPAAGRPQCFGYRPGNTALDPTAAKAIAAAAQRVAAGEPMNQVVEDWNRQGLRTTQGHLWSRNSFRRLLYNPRLAGLTPPSPPIIDEDLHRRLVDAAPAAARTRASDYLLTQLHCGKCGAPMGGRGRRYSCPTRIKLGDGTMSCGANRVSVELLDGHVLGLTAVALVRGAKLPSASVLLAQAEAEAAAADLAWAAHQQLVASGGYSGHTETVRMSNRLNNRRRRAAARLAATRAQLEDLRPPTRDVGRWLDKLSGEQRQQVMTRMWDRIDIEQGTPGTFDAGRVRMHRRGHA
jgi:hypothetical protein